MATSSLSLGEVEVHLVVDVLALGVEPLEDLGEHVDRLLAAQPRPLGLELLQQVHQGVALLQSANRGSSGQCSEGPP